MIKLSDEYHINNDKSSEDYAWLIHTNCFSSRHRRGLVTKSFSSVDCSICGTLTPYEILNKHKFIMSNNNNE